MRVGRSEILGAEGNDERERCAEIVVLGAKEGWTFALVVDEIRARADKAFAPKF